SARCFLSRFRQLPERAVLAPEAISPLYSTLRAPSLDDPLYQRYARATFSTPCADACSLPLQAFAWLPIVMPWHTMMTTFDSALARSATRVVCDLADACVVFALVRPA